MADILIKKDDIKYKVATPFIKKDDIVYKVIEAYIKKDDIIYKTYDNNNLYIFTIDDEETFSKDFSFNRNDTWENIIEQYSDNFFIAGDGDALFFRDDNKNYCYSICELNEDNLNIVHFQESVKPKTYFLTNKTILFTIAETFINNEYTVILKMYGGQGKTWEEIISDKEYTGLDQHGNITNIKLSAFEGMIFIDGNNDENGWGAVQIDRQALNDRVDTDKTYYCYEWEEEDCPFIGTDRCLTCPDKDVCEEYEEE